ncbi:hypothetical protein CYMTET_45808 [Cymbomonas tetramitiformis]|uniref:Uncharacterized protein n=1 Tax=Cymbomonas tetramitiformis TaxID=36881 RepID=A0AAE0BZ99_9CHLO|nr:hypothetical protein CYMTET_45808 [Cymbomonas tetramitiformis]
MSSPSEKTTTLRAQPPCPYPQWPVGYGAHTPPYYPPPPYYARPPPPRPPSNLLSATPSTVIPHHQLPDHQYPPHPYFARPPPPRPPSTPPTATSSTVTPPDYAPDHQYQLYPYCARPPPPRPPPLPCPLNWSHTGAATEPSATGPYSMEPDFAAFPSASGVHLPPRPSCEPHIATPKGKSAPWQQYHDQLLGRMRQTLGALSGASATAAEVSELRTTGTPLSDLADMQDKVLAALKPLAGETDEGGIDWSGRSTAWRAFRATSNRVAKSRARRREKRRAAAAMWEKARGEQARASAAADEWLKQQREQDRATDCRIRELEQAADERRSAR